MRKLFIILFLFLTIPVFALNVLVESFDNIENNSTQNMYFNARVLERAEFKSGLILNVGDVIEGIVTKSVEAKRGKRSGYAIIHLQNIHANGKSILVDDNNIEAKIIYHSKEDWKLKSANAGLHAGLTIGSFYLPGLSQLFYFSKGLIMPYENKTRFKSALASVYEHSPISYIEKGQDINTETGEYLILKLYYADVPVWRYFKRTK